MPDAFLGCRRARAVSGDTTSLGVCCPSRQKGCSRSVVCLCGLSPDEVHGAITTIPNPTLIHALQGTIGSIQVAAVEARIERMEADGRPLEVYKALNSKNKSAISRWWNARCVCPIDSLEPRCVRDDPAFVLRCHRKPACVS